MRQALTAARAEYEGSLVLILYDRTQLRTVRDNFLQVADGQVSPSDGTIEDYLRRRKPQMLNSPIRRFMPIAMRRHYTC